MATAAFAPPTSTVAFEEDIILPAPHSQQDAPDDGEVMIATQIAE
jgi:hypothetical protein